MKIAWNRRVLSLSAVMTLLSLATPAPTRAQNAHASPGSSTGAVGRTVPAGLRLPPVAEASGVVLVVPDVFPEVEGRALLVRTPGQDAILLRPDGADPEILMMSLALLDKLRSDAPAPATGQMIPITGFAVTRGPSTRERVRLDAMLDRVLAEPSAPLGVLGTGRWIPLGG